MSAEEMSTFVVEIIQIATNRTNGALHLNATTAEAAQTATAEHLKAVLGEQQAKAFKPGDARPFVALQVRF